MDYSACVFMLRRPDGVIDANFGPRGINFSAEAERCKVAQFFFEKKGFRRKQLTRETVRVWAAGQLYVERRVLGGPWLQGLVV